MESFAYLRPEPQARVHLLRQMVTWGALALLVILPLLALAGLVAPQDLNRIGRFLCFALVAIGVDLIWGYGGMLSLCQALFFCLGGYVMAMHLALEQGGGDVRPEYNMLPAFFFFNNVEELPWHWIPMQSSIITGLLVVALPAGVAALLGFSIFRSRVRGVYFSIITQALAWGAYIAFCNNTLLLGGTNGLTGFKPEFGTSLGWIIGLYVASALALVGGFLLCRFLLRRRFGRILVAIRDQESRLRFAGYDPVRYKVAAFAIAAALAGIAGALYAPQTGIITPARMAVPEHILLVVWVAVGGRASLGGAVLGALLVNITYSALTSDAPLLWPFVQGALFLSVVLFFPDGLVALWRKAEERLSQGASWMSALRALAPLAVLILWSLMEVLGWMPSFLNWVPAKESLGALAVPLKYPLLAVALIACALWERRSTVRTNASVAEAA